MRRMRTSGICGADAFLFSRYALHNQTSTIGIRALHRREEKSNTLLTREPPHTSFFNHKGGFTNRGKYCWGKARTSGESQPMGGGLKERKEDKKGNTFGRVVRSMNTNSRRPRWMSACPGSFMEVYFWFRFVSTTGRRTNAQAREKKEKIS